MSGDIHHARPVADPATAVIPGSDEAGMRENLARTLGTVSA